MVAGAAAGGRRRLLVVAGAAGCHCGHWGLPVAAGGGLVAAAVLQEVAGAPLQSVAGAQGSLQACRAAQLACHLHLASVLVADALT